MNVGAELLAAARSSGARSIAIVGTGKNVGKTIAMRSVYEAACGAGLRVGLTSIGRDGEAVDVGDAQPKPRLFLRTGTALATARGVLPRSPAGAILELSNAHTAAGALVYVRVERPGYFELIGPPSASALRDALGRLAAWCDVTILDGAVDRVAALAGGDDATIVACGAAASHTMEEAIDDARALVRRLSVARADERAPALEVEGALTPGEASRLIAQRETRQVVVRDPTRIAMTGKAALYALDRLTIRCRRPLRVVAVTVASIGRERSFEPRTFARAVAAATGLPTYDVYTGERSVA